MLLLLFVFSLLLVANIQANTPEESEDAERKYDTEDLLKTALTTYYELKGLRNETTDNMMEAFFGHEFNAYPNEVYPAFKKIFEHISKSNDRLWNFYESVLYLYRNVAAADRIYETVLRRASLGKLLKESGELYTETFPLDDQLGAENEDMRRRSGEIMEDEEPLPVWDEKPCESECDVEPLQVGSFRAIPGVHFPNYEDIPITSFTCAGKHIPSFYADLETGCQVFHVCYPHRRESFLCPIGTTFNQAILACDYWYSSNCSLAPLYFHFNLITEDKHFEEGTESFVDHLLEQYENIDTYSTSTPRPVDHTTKKPRKTKSPKIKISLPNIDWSLMIKFLPIKSKITECPDFCGKPTVDYTDPTPGSVPVFSEYPEMTTARPILSTVSPKEDKYDDRWTVATATPKEDKYDDRWTVATATPKEDKYDYRWTVATATPKEDAHHERFTVSPQKEKYDVKTTKSEILLDILKAVEVLTKDAEGFLTEVVQKKRQHRVVPSGIKTSPKHPKSKPTRAYRYSPKKPIPVPEINPRFVVKPVKPVENIQRPKISRSKLLKPSKTIEGKKQALFRKKEPAKVILEGMKAIAHLFN